MKISALSALCLLNIAGVTVCAQPSNDGAAMVPSQPAVQTPTGPQDRPPLPTIAPNEALHLTGGPTLITLNATRADPRQVWEDIARQAGIKLDPWPPELLRRKWPAITLRSQREPFWSVMQRFCEQVEWALSFSSKTGRWQVSPYNGEGRKWLTGIIQKAGPFHVLASSISTSTSARLYWNTDNPLKQQQQQAATFQILPDPHLMPLLLSEVSARCESAVDEEGKPLGVFDAISDFQKLSRSEGVLWHLSLPWLKKSLSKAANFEVNTRTLLVLERERWEIPVIVAPDGQAEAHATRTFETSQGRVTYRVELTPDGPSYSVGLSRPVDLAWKEPSFFFPDLPQEGVLWVVDGQNHRLYNNGGGAGATYQVRMLRQDPWGKNGVGIPAKIIVNMPTDIRRLEVPFYFRSLPLQ